jgi:hypothetical protein
MENYNPPKLFFGEDQYFKSYVLKTGYKWKVLPFIGATHLGTSKDYVTVGVSYRRYGHFGFYKPPEDGGAAAFDAVCSLRT